MPASPSLPSSDGRGKWKRRKREPQITRKPPKHEEPLPDDDDDEDALDDDNHHNSNNADREDSEDPHHSAAVPDPGLLQAEVIEDCGVRICDFPPATRLTVNRPHASVMAVVAAERENLAGESGADGRLNLENVSHGQLQALSAVPAGEVDLERSDGAYVVTPPQVMDGKGVVKKFWDRVLVVPMHSDWFSPATVHRLERQVVPHFFSGKSPEHTPEKYMECRNYIVAKYIANTEKRLTVSDCQGSIGGVDTEDLTRIVRFLDHWGIINYSATPQTHECWNVGSYLREDPDGEVHVPSAALKSIDSLIKFERPKCTLKAADFYLSSSCLDDDSSDLDNRIQERLCENFCNYCSQPVPTVYYQSQKEADILLCSECFHDGRFVTGHSSLDFVRLDSTKDYGDLDGESWTDQETLLLLEAMEIYNENWNEIAEHVGSKSKAQCILHFLRLPVEDGLLESIEVPSMTKSAGSSNREESARLHSSSNGSCAQDDSESRLPFVNSGNPVMSLVTFLASAVGPRVAAACAHASLAALSEDNRRSLERSHGKEGGLHGELTNSVHQKGNLHGAWGQNEGGIGVLTIEKVRAAAKVGLAAAATKAKLFADHEEREIQRLSANVINYQLKRLELKLKQFAEVETFLMRECEQVEKTRQRFAAERLRILSTRIGPAGVSSQMNLAGGIAHSAGNNSLVPNRQQVMPSSSSQPSISGYGHSQQLHPHSNQQVHPHMTFMQRNQGQPSMFPLGLRLPLSAIQPSSTAAAPPPNVMFNASGNPQPCMNQMLRSNSGLG